MNRNSKSHFSTSDNRINIGRSKFNRDSWYKTSFNAGDLIPFYVDEVLPGDTFELKTSLLARMATPLFPVMDNAYLDTYFFFVPNRLVWDHWKAFNGENDVNAWTQLVDYEIPQILLCTSVYNSFTLSDYFGIPLNNSGVIPPAGTGDTYLSVNALPFRAYHLIWNEWFRDQNLQDPFLIDKGDASVFGDTPAGLALNKLHKVNKFHDYFTSCLPAPQKGAAVQIPGLGSDLPVIATGNIDYSRAEGYPLKFAFANGVPVDGNRSLGVSNGSVRSTTPAGTSETFSNDVAPVNLDAVVSGASIDALRTAFQIQKLLWRDANGGTRYTEILRSHFGVVSPDARLQRPEYLGGKRTPITMNQVLQQSAAENEPTPLGNTGAYSKTVDSFDGFTKSFTEHGYLIGVCCVRTDHTYQNGINRLWSRRDRFDFYYPELANIGNQPVFNKEIYVDFNNSVNDEVFGYQEAWAEYRYRPSYVTGAFRSNYPGGSLDSWHYADYYDTTPALSAEWIEEPTENLNRTLAVTSSEDNHEQILLDMFFDLKTTRPMPMYSVPGLVDHF